MVKKVLLSILLLALFAAVYFYNQPNARYFVAVGLKKNKLESNIRSLGSKKTCANEIKKSECFFHFFRANGSIEFSEDLPLFVTSIFTICEKNIPCALELSDQLFQTVDFNTFWLRKSKFANSKFAKETMPVELEKTDAVLRGFRKRLMTDFVIEQEPARKKLIVEYVKNIDAKLIELGLAH